MLEEMQLICGQQLIDECSFKLSHHWFDYQLFHPLSEHSESHLLPIEVYQSRDYARLKCRANMLECLRTVLLFDDTQPVSICQSK